MSTASRAIRRASMPVTRRLILIIVAIAVVVGGGIVAAKVWADSIQEYTNTFLINSVGIGGDNNPGDDECETGPVGSKECTLRAALEEANVTSDKDLIQVDDAWAQSWTPTPTQPIPTINVSAQPSGWMTTTKIDGELEGGTTNGNVSEEDNGAVFTVTNPVTLDLGRKLSARYEVDGPKMALFFVNGPDVTIKGVVDSYTPETTFYVGPKANNVKITDGSVATANFYPDRFLVVRGGATNIEVSYFSISGYYDDSAVGSWGMVLGTDTTHRVNGLTLDHNTYSTSLSSSSVCNETSSAGCNSGALRLNRQGGQWVDNLKFTNNTSNNLNHHVRHTTPRFLNASTAKLNGVTISGNTVNNAAAPTNPVFDLNSATVTGDVTFTDNVVNGLVSAKALLGLTSTSVTGGVTISDNRIKDSARTTSLFNFSASQITGAVTMEKNTIVGSTSTAAVGIVELDTASYGSLTMRDNVFTGLTAASIENLGIVRLPVDRAIGATLIEKNVFQASTAAPGAAPLPAIYWNGPYSSGGNTTKSGLTIQNNVFDGFGQGYDRATIRLYESGISTVQGNTFGARTITQAANVSLLEEGIAPDNRAAAMYQNFNLSSNQKMNTWFPAAVRSKGLGAGATQYQTEDRTEGGTPSVIDAQACAIPLELASPSDLNNGMYIAGARNPGDSVTLDVYWTQANTAEVYLGSIKDLATLPKAANGNPIATIPLPSLNDSRLDSMKMPKLNPDGTRATDAQGDPIMVFLDGTADGSNGTVLPVGADGQVRGGLRVQTQDPTIPNSQTVSSQYSRVAKIGGTCTPTLTINRAKADATTGEKEQNRTTSARDIHFTLVSNMPIDSTTLELSDFLVGGSTALNARVTAITALPSGSTTVFDVVARADDSGDITLSLPADAVTGPGGLTNTAASTSTDGVVTYRNPLIVAPSPLRLIAGEASGEDYTISIDPMAPKEPIAPLTFTIGLDAIGQTYNLAVSPTSPSISVDETSTTVRVTVPALPDGSTIPPATVATITHTVDTTDQEYAGLRVPSLAADLYSTNPQIKIDKEVYTCPDTTTSADNNYDYITKSGNCTVIPSNSSLKDAEKVWFVFTVENTSPDTWPTSLSGIQVTDDTLTDGTTCGPKFSHPCVIGTLPSLARGETHGFVWERNPVAIHTTQEGGV